MIRPVRPMGLIGLIVMVGLILLAPLFMSADHGLVPHCGQSVRLDAPGIAPEDVQTRTELIPCTTCHLFELVLNILNFIWNPIAIVIAALMFSYGGILMIVPSFGGSVAMYESGKKVLKNTLLGLVIVFAAWLIIDTIIKVIVGNPQFGVLSQEPGQIFPKTEYGPWNKLTCTAPPPLTTVAGSIPAASPTERLGPPAQPFGPITTDMVLNRQNAQRLEDLCVSDNICVPFNASGDCSALDPGTGGPTRVSAATNFNELKQGLPLTVCFNGCRSGGSCTAQSGFTATPKMSSDLVILSHENNLRFEVTSISTGSHAPLSAHYAGKAVDLKPKNPTQSEYLKLRDAMKSLNPGSPRVACEDNGGNIITGCGAGTTHIHVTYP